MELRQLKYFVAIAEQENFGKASALLRIAQPALSRQIALLETELGTPLFIRHARGAVPTEAAKRLLVHAHAILDSLAQAKNDLAALQSVPSGTVVLGIHPSLALRLATPLISACLAELPHVRIELIEGYSQSIADMALAGRVDFAVMNELARNASPAIDALLYEPLLCEEFTLIGPPQPWLSETAPIEPQELVSIPLIMGRYRQGGMRDVLHLMMEEIGHTPNIVAEADSIITVKEVIKQGYGYTINLAVSVEQDIRDGLLAARPIRGLRMTRMLARSRDHPQSRGAQEVIRLIRQVVQHAVETRSWPGASLVNEPA